VRLSTSPHHAAYRVFTSARHAKRREYPRPAPPTLPRRSSRRVQYDHPQHPHVFHPPLCHVCHRKPHVYHHFCIAIWILFRSLCVSHLSSFSRTDTSPDVSLIPSLLVQLSTHMNELGYVQRSTSPFRRSNAIQHPNGNRVFCSGCGHARRYADRRCPFGTRL
jgi:hypothetical protein